MTKIKLTKNEIGALFEQLGDTQVEENTLTTFDKLDKIATIGGSVDLSDSERMKLKNIAKYMEIYIVEKYNINKSKLVKKLS